MEHKLTYFLGWGDSHGEVQQLRDSLYGGSSLPGRPVHCGRRGGSEGLFHKQAAVWETDRRLRVGLLALVKTWEVGRLLNTLRLQHTQILRLERRRDGGRGVETAPSVYSTKFLRGKHIGSSCEAQERS